MVYQHETCLTLILYPNLLSNVYFLSVKQGKQTITRSSTQSSVTIPFERTYRDLSNVPAERQQLSNFCGCGWPHNLLIPKGKPEGMPCELFVMISNYADDKVRNYTILIMLMLNLQPVT